MHPLARPEGYQLADLRFQAAPGRRGSIAGGKRNKERVRGRHDKRNPRQELVACREPQVVQRDLRQPRTELAVSRDQKAQDPIFTQRGLKVFRLSEDPRDAAWHPPSPNAG